MRRSASESSRFDVPGCWMQVPPLQASVKAATGTLMGPVSVEIGREHAAVARGELEALLRRCRAGQHGRAIVGTELRTGERLTVVEDVEGDVVRIRPDAELRIVVELRGTVTERI